MTDRLRLGSLCSGYRGLDIAIEEVFGATTAWVSDIDAGANQILAHHWPTTPNIGDLTTAQWADVEPVDIVCGGYPCQPFSLAGELKGTDDERHLWPFIARALRVLRPRYAIFENVANHLRLGFDTVLCDLADLGFDVEWCVVRADEVGAPHQRRRLILLATAADAAHLGHERRGSPRRGGHGPADGCVAAADASRDVRRLGDRDAVSARGDAHGRGTGAGTGAAADSGRGGQRPHLEVVQPGQPDIDWGDLAPAIHRWETVLGRRNPGPTDDRGRLSPAFVEWMMGLPAGHVTAVPGLSRAQQLKALGNGVVPQQAAAALRLLHRRASLPQSA